MDKKSHKQFYRDCLFLEYYKHVFGGKKSFLLKRIKKQFSFRFFNIDYSNYKMVYLIRKMQYHYQFPTKNKVSRVLHIYRGIRIQKTLIKNYSSYIHPNCFIDKGLRIAHPLGIVIGADVIIGKNFTLFHKTTIGARRAMGCVSQNDGFPTMGDNCILYSNAMMLGKIKVGDNVAVGAGSILLDDALEKGTYVGTPAKIVK